MEYCENIEVLITKEKKNFLKSNISLPLLLIVFFLL